MSVCKWRIYCNTESDWTYGYLEEGQTPSTCFTDTGHTVNSNSHQMIGTVSNSQIVIQEESTPTGGNFKAVNYKLLCPTGLSSHDYTFPHPISALSITLPTVSDNQDDNLEVCVGPNTIIGSITSNVSVSDTVLTVSQTVIDNVQLGFYIDLYNGTNTENMGRITAIDTNALTITMEIATTQAFLASTPTYVRVTVNVIDEFTIGPPSRLEIGKDKIGGSYVPTGTIIRVKYINNGGSSKNFYCMIEYLY